MKKHIKAYMKFFDLVSGQTIPSELSKLKANDIHHIDCRGMGGSKEKDYIENLIALTREEHDKYGDKKIYKFFLYKRHIAFIKLHRPDYEIQYDRIPEPYSTELKTK